MLVLILFLFHIKSGLPSVAGRLTADSGKRAGIRKRANGKKQRPGQL